MTLVSFDSLGVLDIADRELLDLISGGSAHYKDVGVNPKCNGEGAYWYEGVNGNCGASNSGCPTDAYCTNFP